jgi:hypothetical protein
MVRISASVKDRIDASVKAIAKKEQRSFSKMVEILLDEAITTRVIPILDKKFNKSKSTKK